MDLYSYHEKGRRAHRRTHWVVAGLCIPFILVGVVLVAAGERIGGLTAIGFFLGCAMAAGGVLASRFSTLFSAAGSLLVGLSCLGFLASGWQQLEEMGGRGPVWALIVVGAPGAVFFGLGGLLLLTRSLRRFRRSRAATRLSTARSR